MADFGSGLRAPDASQRLAEVPVVSHRGAGDGIGLLTRGSPSVSARILWRCPGSSAARQRRCARAGRWPVRRATTSPITGFSEANLPHRRAIRADLRPLSLAGRRRNASSPGSVRVAPVGAGSRRVSALVDGRRHWPRVPWRRSRRVFKLGPVRTSRHYLAIAYRLARHGGRGAYGRDPHVVGAVPADECFLRPMASTAAIFLRSRVPAERVAVATCRDWRSNIAC